MRRDSDRSIDSTKMDANTEYAAFYRCVPVPCAYRLFAPLSGQWGEKVAAGRPLCPYGSSRRGHWHGCIAVHWDKHVDVEKPNASPAPPAAHRATKPPSGGGNDWSASHAHWFRAVALCRRNSLSSSRDDGPIRPAAPRSIAQNGGLLSHLIPSIPSIPLQRVPVAGRIYSIACRLAVARPCRRAS